MAQPDSRMAKVIGDVPAGTWTHAAAHTGVVENADAHPQNG